MKKSLKLYSFTLLPIVGLLVASNFLSNTQQPLADDKWDSPSSAGISINSLISVTEDDKNNFSDEEWAEILRRVEAGSIAYTVISEEGQLLNQYVEENGVPPLVITSNQVELSLDNAILSSQEKLQIFKYYHDNDCSGTINVEILQNDDSGEIVITSFYNSDNQLITSDDKGISWTVD